MQVQSNPVNYYLVITDSFGPLALGKETPYIFSKFNKILQKRIHLRSTFHIYWNKVYKNEKNGKLVFNASSQ